MAAVTVNSQHRRLVLGHLVAYLFNDVDIASDGDTQVIGGLSRIWFAAATSPTNNAIGCTISGNTITWQTGGAESNALVIAIGEQ